MLSIVDRRCAWSENWKPGKKEGEGRRGEGGERDMKERKVRSDCGMKGRGIGVFDSC